MIIGVFFVGVYFSDGLYICLSMFSVVLFWSINKVWSEGGKLVWYSFIF